MEHRLITGGHEYLPFARSCVVKLKKLGLPYADQSFEVGGASIKVRIEPGHEYITITGNALGRYIVFPHSYAHTGGILDENGEFPNASVSISNRKAKVEEHTQKESSLTDWKSRSGKDVVTYNTGCNSRYRLSLTLQTTNDAQPDIFVNGKRISTDGIPVAGAAIARMTENGVTVERYVIIANWVNYIYHPAVDAYAYQDDHWVWIGGIITHDLASLDGDEGSEKITLGGGQIVHVGTSSPWYFDPHGTSAVSLMSDEYNSNLMKKVIRMKLTLSIGVISAAFTIGEVVGNLASDSYHENQPDATITQELRAVGSGQYEMYGSGLPGTSYTRYEIVYKTVANGIGWIFTGNDETVNVLAIDYDQKTAGEIVVSLKHGVVGEAGHLTSGSGETGGAINGHQNIPLPSAGEFMSDTYYTAASSDSPETFNYYTTDYHTTKGLFGLYVDDSPIVEFLATGRFGYGTTEALYADGSRILPTVDIHESTDFGQDRIMVYELDARDKTAVYEHFHCKGIVSSEASVAPTVRPVEFSSTSTLRAVMGGKEVFSQRVWEVPPATRLVALSVLIGDIPNRTYIVEGVGMTINQFTTYQLPTWSVFSICAEPLSLADRYDMSHCTASRKKEQRVFSVHLIQPGARTRYEFPSLGVASPAVFHMMYDKGMAMNVTEFNKVPLYSTTPADGFSASPVTLY